jgi:hypothetical protein
MGWAGMIFFDASKREHRTGFAINWSWCCLAGLGTGVVGCLWIGFDDAFERCVCRLTSPSLRTIFFAAICFSLRWQVGQEGGI